MTRLDSLHQRHLCSIRVAPVQLQRSRSHGGRGGGDIAEGRLPQRGNALQFKGGSDPGGGGGARVGQAEGVVQAGPAVVVSRLRERERECERERERGRERERDRE